MSRTPHKGHANNIWELLLSMKVRSTVQEGDNGIAYLYGVVREVENLKRR